MLVKSNLTVVMNSKKSRKPLVRIVVWLVAEVILNLIGLDDLADYSEFVLEKRLVNHQVIVSEEHTDDTSADYSGFNSVYSSSPKLQVS